MLIFFLYLNIIISVTKGYWDDDYDYLVSIDIHVYFDYVRT